MPYRPRTCLTCGNDFTPPRKGGMLATGYNHLTHCAQCRRAVKDAIEGNPPGLDSPIPHTTAAPLKQVVFDLETWGLDRGWGVTMVASGLIHGFAAGTKRFTYTLRDFKSWKQGKRSDDREIVEAVFKELNQAHIAYAHNGERFDIRWLRTVALKYQLEMPKLKLVDPAAMAWKKYRIGRNSLEAVADFLELDKKGKTKMHISPDTWRHALMDDDDEAWKLLIERCESDVDLLNEVASRVTGDVGMIDYSGSWR